MHNVLHRHCNVPKVGNMVVASVSQRTTPLLSGEVSDKIM